MCVLRVHMAAANGTYRAHTTGQRIQLIVITDLSLGALQNQRELKRQPRHQNAVKSQQEHQNVHKNQRGAVRDHQSRHDHQRIQKDQNQRHQQPTKQLRLC